MITALIAIAELAFIVCILAAIEKRGYRRGEKSGFDRGFLEGRKSADNWWINLEYDVTQERAKIEREERWP